MKKAFTQIQNRLKIEPSESKNILFYKKLSKPEETKIMTYQEAQKQAKVNKGHFYTYAAGNGKIAGTYFCKVRNRVINQWSNDGKIWY